MPFVNICCLSLVSWKQTLNWRSVHWRFIGGWSGELYMWRNERSRTQHGAGLNNDVVATQTSMILKGTLELRSPTELPYWGKGYRPFYSHIDQHWCRPPMGWGHNIGPSNSLWLRRFFRWGLSMRGQYLIAPAPKIIRSLQPKRVIWASHDDIHYSFTSWLSGFPFYPGTRSSV